MPTIADSDVRCAYDALAHAYDDLTAGYRYDRWLAELEALACLHGLSGKRLLDAACGTGKSFMPMLDRGYDITAFDLSPEMVRRAAQRAPHATTFVADLRDLDAVDQFDLITCLDDSLNYLLDANELLAALEGFRRNLAPDGVAIWDLNTLAMYRSSFASDWVNDAGTNFITWRGSAAPDFAPGTLVEVEVDVFTAAGDGWSRSTSIHRQRHWPASDVIDMAAEAGLRIVDVRGQHPGAVIDSALDELVHTKAVFVAWRDDRPDTQEVIR